MFTQHILKKKLNQRKKTNKNNEEIPFYSWEIIPF